MPDLELIAEKYPALVSMANRLHAQATASVEDPQALQMAIVGRMLEAEDEESLFAAQSAGTIAGQEWLNKPFRLKKNGITVRKSSLEDSTIPWYVLLEVTDFTTGEMFTLNCGAPSVIGILDKLVQWDDEGRGSFSNWEEEGGRAFQLIGKSMGSGNTLLHIVPLEMQSKKKPAANGKRS